MCAGSREIGAYVLSENGNGRTLAFGEILLDETLVDGEIWVKEDALREAGGLNRRIRGKRGYELLLRVAQSCGVVCGAPEKAEQLEGFRRVVEEVYSFRDGLQTDCYLIGRYKKELLAMGCFDDAVLGILENGGEESKRYLEEMLSETKTYHWLYDATQPILVYVGDTICYGVLDVFARSLGKALEDQGFQVIYFDLSRQEIRELGDYIGKRLQAVIGMQTYVFSARMKDGDFLHDRIEAPIYHFVFDHPVWLRNHLESVPVRERILTPDRGYAQFVRTYYRHPAYFLPPAGRGETIDRQKQRAEREYEVSFLGSCQNKLLERLILLRKKNKADCHFVSRYIRDLNIHRNDAPEEVLMRTLEHYGITCDRQEFLERFYAVRWAVLGIAERYRYKVVKRLLEAGITLHVFGDSWRECPLYGHPGLVWHKAALGDEALQVYARSKISLNIMTWHKDGFTERIANAMLQGSVVVTDKSRYLEENFVDGQELLLFDLGDLEQLPERINELLADEERRGRIAERGRQKALREHTWERRAETLIGWLDENR